VELASFDVDRFGLVDGKEFNDLIPRNSARKPHVGEADVLDLLEGFEAGEVELKPPYYQRCYLSKVVEDLQQSCADHKG
jgi:hypothetical protein